MEANFIIPKQTFLQCLICKFIAFEKNLFKGALC